MMRFLKDRFANALGWFGAVTLMIGMGLALPATVAAEEIVLTDMAGRSVRLPGPAIRIVTTFKPATLCIFSLGLEKRLVGIDTESTREPFHLALWPGVKDVTPVGTKSNGLNIETIVSLKPDLIILYAQKDGVHTADRLAAAGIPAMVILPENFQSLARCLGLIATAAGEPAAAARATGVMGRTLALARSRVADLTAGQKKRCYYAAPRGFFTTASADLLQHEMIRAAGGVNVAVNLSGYFRDISQEQFARWRPDVVVVSSHIRGQARRVARRREFAHIPAFVHGRVYAFPSSLCPWDFPSPLSSLGVLWLSARFYPERYSDLDLATEIDRFHRDLYGRSLTDMKGRLDDEIMH
ncbi:MAG: ABC transporter substrate-binding protein [Desulfobacterales bacterium]|nr:ABC transporter substrate-binding protein [Desulfobacterales bacterium]